MRGKIETHVDARAGGGPAKLEAPPKLTKKQAEGLAVLASFERPVSGGPFAERMWVAARRAQGGSLRTGTLHGYRRRGGAWLSALCKLGLVRWTSDRLDPNVHYQITDLGRRALAVHAQVVEERARRRRVRVFSDVIASRNQHKGKPW